MLGDAPPNGIIDGVLRLARDGFALLGIGGGSYASSFFLASKVGAGLFFAEVTDAGAGTFGTGDP